MTADVSVLDDPTTIQKIDTHGFLSLLRAFPEQVEAGIKLGSATELKFEPTEFNSILITGMGGSAIGGDILAAWLYGSLNIPIIVNRGYYLPGCATHRTLLFVASYSGNTEETISACLHGIDKGCKLIAISSNGKLETLCKERNITLIKIQQGMPPRASVAYLFFPMVGILQKLQLINANDECEAVLSTLHNLSAKIVPEVPVQNNVAKQLAHKLYNKFVVVYGQSYYSAIAKRFRTQLNENPKILARDDEFPEMCHNDLSGWSGELYETTAKIATVLIRDKAEHPQIRKRIEFAKSLFADKGSTVIEIWAPDSDYVLPKMMYVMYICDFISVYLSILRGVDPTPVEIIERLKEAIK